MEKIKNKMSKKNKRKIINYELISLFLIFFMIGSSLTPFAYTIKKSNQQPFKKLNLAAERRLGRGSENTEEANGNIGGECKDKVWIDELNWSEYHRLLNDTIKQVDAFGNKDEGVREQNFEKSGLPSNPDVIGMQQQTIPGVDGKPALLYDVLGKKAVNANKFCHLNNIITTGRVSYATRLTGYIRYCSNNSAECEKAMTQKDKTKAQEAIKDIKSLEEQLTNKDNVDWDTFKKDINSYKKNDEFKKSITKGFTTEINKDTPNKAKISNELAEMASDLIISSSNNIPNSYVESPSIHLTLNADKFLLVPKTIQDWLNFLKSFRTLDAATTAMNIANAAGGFAQIGSGVIRNAREIRESGETLSLSRRILGGLFGSRTGLTAERLGRLTEAERGAERSGRILTATRKVENVLKDITHGEEEADVGKSFLKNKIEMRDALKGLQKGLGESIKSTLKDVAGINIKNVEELSADDVYRINDLNPSTTEAIMNDLNSYNKLGYEIEDLGGITDDTTEISNIIDRISETNNEIRNGFTPTRWSNWYEGTRLSRRIASGGRLARSIELIRRILTTGIGGRFTPIKMLVTYQKMLWITYGLTWLNNQAFSQGIYDSNVATIDINNETIKTAHMNELESYFEIRKTADKAPYEKYLLNAYDTFFNLLGKETDTVLTNKIKSIQDIVFIYDQDAYASRVTGEHPVNIITSPLETGSEWKFFSSINDESVVYNFEHPNGYMGGGKYSALAFVIKNINLGAIVAESDDKFQNTPLRGIVSGSRMMRDLTGVGLLFSFIPSGTLAGVSMATGSLKLLIPIGIGLGVGTTAATKGYFATAVYNILNSKYGGVNNLKEVYNNPNAKLCSGVFEGKKGEITYLKWAVAITSLVSASLTATGVGTPVGVVVDVVNMISTHYEEKDEEAVTKGLTSCVETEFDAIAYKEILTDANMQKNTQDSLQPLKEEMFNIIGSMSPKATQILNNISNNIVQNTLGVTGNLYTKNIVSSTGKEIYHLHFKDGAIKWFQSDNCEIQLCQQEEGGTNYKCGTQQGYMLYGADGEPVLNGAPQAISLEVDLDNGQMSLVQKVIEIKKQDNNANTIMKITKDGITITSNCLKTALKKLLGLDGITRSIASEEEINNRITENLGKLEAIYTEEANIWFNQDNTLMIQFNKDTEQHSAGEILRIDNASIEFSNTNNGKIIIKENGERKLALNLSTTGVISFDNGMLRSGLVQTINKGNEDTEQTFNFSDQFHLFIHGLTELALPDINDINISDYCNEDGTLNGVKLQVDLLSGKLNPDDLDTIQTNNILNNICFSEFDTADGGHVSITADGQLCIEQPDGTKQCTDVTPTEDGDGLKSSDGSIWKIEEGPNGPEWRQYDVNGERTGRNPLPIINMNGLGGSWTTGADGRISIKNTFPFALNPSFNQYGAGGLGLMTPQLPPWGGRVTAKQPTIGVGEQGNKNNILAQLPGLPENKYWFTIFLIALISSLIIIRTKYTEKEIKQMIKKTKK